MPFSILTPFQTAGFCLATQTASPTKIPSAATKCSLIPDSNVHKESIEINGLVVTPL